MNKGLILNIIQFFVILAMGYFLWFHKSDTPVYDKELIELERKQLQDRNIILIQELGGFMEKQAYYEHQIDSLQSIPAQIKIKYVNIYKKIDGYTAAQLVHELDSAYANSDR